MKNKKNFIMTVAFISLAGCSSQSSQNLSKETIAIGKENQTSLSSDTKQLKEKELLSKFKPIFFKFDSANLNYDAQRKIQSMAEAIKLTKLQHPILINGYSDPIGTRPYNFQLAKDRATQVRNHLVEIGVSPEQLKVVSYGEVRRKSAETQNYLKLRKVELSFPSSQSEVLNEKLTLN